MLLKKNNILCPKVGSSIISNAKLISKFEIALKESAVDCKLNKYANVYSGENDIKCIE